MPIILKKFLLLLGTHNSQSNASIIYLCLIKGVQRSEMSHIKDKLGGVSMYFGMFARATIEFQVFD